MKRIAKRTIFLIAALTLWPPAARLGAVEISLNGFVVKGNQSSSSIGYVDIEKIFANHPLTKRLQEDFNAEADKRKQAMSDLQKAINDMQSSVKSSSTLVTQMKIELENMKSNLNSPATQQFTLAAGTSAPVAVSTAAANSVAVSSATAKPPVDAAAIAAKEKLVKDDEAGIANMRLAITKKEQDLCDFTDKCKKDMVDLEKKQTDEVLADIYGILEKITVEENLSMIVDKTNVLYGHPAQDYTDRVLERLQGR